jgi:hypothetical protein
MQAHAEDSEKEPIPFKRVSDAWKLPTDSGAPLMKADHESSVPQVGIFTG